MPVINHPLTGTMYTARKRSHLHGHPILELEVTLPLIIYISMVVRTPLPLDTVVVRECMYTLLAPGSEGRLINPWN